MGRRRSPGAKGAVQVWKPWRFNRTLQPNLLLICLWFKQKLLNLPGFLPEEDKSKTLPSPVFIFGKSFGSLAPRQGWAKA